MGHIEHKTSFVWTEVLCTVPFASSAVALTALVSLVIIRVCQELDSKFDDM